MENTPQVEKAFGTIGLLVKSGQAVFGEDGCVALIRSGQAGLILVDEEASENAKKRYQDSCRFYHTPLAMAPAGMIARASGRSGRMAMGIKPGGLANKLMELLANQIMVFP